MRKRIRLRGWLVLTGLVLVLGVTGYFRYQWHRPLPVSSPTVVELKPGTGFSAFAREMQAQGVIRDARLLILEARLTGAARQIHAGEYRIGPEDTLASLLSRLVRGDVVQHAYTLVDGITFREMRAQLDALPRLHHDTLNLTADAIMAKLDGQRSSPEGWFAPDTYFYVAGDSDWSILQRAYQRQQAILRQAWDGRDDGLPYQSPYDALIMASIVEKETGAPAERAEIAGVFVRRLQKGMRLQTDPTVIYGLGPGFDGNLTRKELHTPTPYNTYTRSGLPPTPIAMPGKAAIEAAVHPEPGNALYFVARGDGTHQFSDTLQEQEQAIRKYQWHRSKDYHSAPEARAQGSGSVAPVGSTGNPSEGEAP